MVQEYMTEKELANFLLDKLSDLERVEHAPNRDEEIAYQKNICLQNFNLSECLQRKL